MPQVINNASSSITNLVSSNQVRKSRVQGCPWTFQDEQQQWHLLGKSITLGNCTIMTKHGMKGRAQNYVIF